MKHSFDDLYSRVSGLETGMQAVMAGQARQEAKLDKLGEQNIERSKLPLSAMAGWATVVLGLCAFVGNTYKDNVESKVESLAGDIDSTERLGRVRHNEQEDYLNWLQRTRTANVFEPLAKNGAHLNAIEKRLDVIERNRFTGSDAVNMKESISLLREDFTKMGDRLPPPWLLDRVSRLEDLVFQSGFGACMMPSEH